jgi:hypothetical protein
MTEPDVSNIVLIGIVDVFVWSKLMEQEKPIGGEKKQLQYSK